MLAQWEMGVFTNSTPYITHTFALCYRVYYCLAFLEVLRGPIQLFLFQLLI